MTETVLWPSGRWRAFLRHWLIFTLLGPLIGLALFSIFCIPTSLNSTVWGILATNTLFAIYLAYFFGGLPATLAGLLSGILAFRSSDISHRSMMIVIMAGTLASMAFSLVLEGRSTLFLIFGLTGACSAACCARLAIKR